MPVVLGCFRKCVTPRCFLGKITSMKTLDQNSKAAVDLASGRYQIRRMSLRDFETVTIPWMQAAGWNPGLRDAGSFFAADAQGFLMGGLVDVPIACVSAVRYDVSFGFLGCYLVEAAYRGYGYGLALHEAARRHLQGCLQGGDGVLENVEKYKRIGRVYAYQNARYEGVKSIAWHSPGSGSCMNAREVAFAELEQLDRACFPAARTAFLKAWIHQPGAHALALVGEPGRRLLGYGVIRPCFRGWKIGPLFSRDAASAESLFCGLVDRIPAGETFFLDIAEPNLQALEMVRRHGMTQVFATARMYTGPAPHLELGWIYGVTTFELG